MLNKIIMVLNWTRVGKELILWASPLSHPPHFLELIHLPHWFSSPEDISYRRIYFFNWTLTSTFSSGDWHGNTFFPLHIARQSFAFLSSISLILFLKYFLWQFADYLSLHRRDCILGYFVEIEWTCCPPFHWRDFSMYRPHFYTYNYTSLERISRDQVILCLRVKIPYSQYR